MNPENVEQAPSEEMQEIGNKYLAMLNEDHPDAKEFKMLETRLINRFLSKSPEFARLENLLKEQVKDNELIQNTIQKLREELTTDPYLKAEGHLVNYYFPNVISSREVLIEEGYVPMTDIDPTEVKYLYHWAPKNKTQKILEEGLLPAFCTADGRSSYVYSAFNPDSWWYWSYNKQYPGNFDNKNYEKDAKANSTLFGIKVTTDLQAYTWAQKYYVSGSGSPLHSWPYELVSSKVLPLDVIMGYNVFLDKELLKENSRGKRKSDKYKKLYGRLPPMRQPFGYEDAMWKYSPWLDQEVPSDSATNKTDEYTEVLLDYVSPDNLVVIEKF